MISMMVGMQIVHGGIKAKQKKKPLFSTTLRGPYRIL